VRSPVRSARRPPLLAAAFFLAVLLVAGIRSVPAASRSGKPIPKTLRVEARWGREKNRESYRAGLERSIVEALAADRCFAAVISEGTGDLWLDVLVNVLETEEEYASSESILPGQPVEPMLLAARATVDLDYWLLPEGRDEPEIHAGHLFREFVREPQGPGDAAEERAFREILADASRWVARDLCEGRSSLARKVDTALAASPEPTPGTVQQPPQESPKP